MVKVLLAAGAVKNVKDKVGVVVLLMSKRGGQIGLARQLPMGGVAMPFCSLPSQIGRTALGEELAKGRHDVVNILRGAGAQM